MSSLSARDFGDTPMAESIFSEQCGLQKDVTRSCSANEMEMFDRTRRSSGSDDDTVLGEWSTKSKLLETEDEYNGHGMIPDGHVDVNSTLTEEFELIVSLVKRGDTLSSEQYTKLLEGYKASASRLADVKARSTILEEKLCDVKQEIITKEMAAADEKYRIVTEIHRMNAEAKLKWQKLEVDYDTRKRAVINRECRLERSTRKCKERTRIKLHQVEQMRENMENEKQQFEEKIKVSEKSLRKMKSVKKNSKGVEKQSKRNEQDTGVKSKMKIGNAESSQTARKNTTNSLLVSDSSLEESITKDPPSSSTTENIKERQSELIIESEKIEDRTSTPKDIHNENTSTEQVSTECQGKNTESLEQSTPKLTGTEDDFGNASFNFGLSASGKKQVARKKQRSESDGDCSSEDEVNRTTVEKMSAVDKEKRLATSPKTTESLKSCKRTRVVNEVIESDSITKLIHFNIYILKFCLKLMVAGGLAER